MKYRIAWTQKGSSVVRRGERLYDDKQEVEELTQGVNKRYGDHIKQWVEDVPEE